MAEEKKVVIDNVEYAESELSDEAKVCINHVGSLDNKIASAEFNLTQLKVGRQAFLDMLKANLEKTDDAG